MNLPTVQLEVKNIPENMIESFKPALQSLLEESPYDSNLCVTVNKTPMGYYTGKLKVLFCHGVFNAEARNHDLQKTLTTLLSRAQSQIAEWKKTRVFDQSDEVPTQELWAVAV